MLNCWLTNVVIELHLVHQEMVETFRILNNKIKLLCSVGLTGHYLIYQGKTSCIIIGFNPLLSNAYSIITFIRIPSRSEHLIFMQL